MHAHIHVSLIAGLSIAGIGAAAADSDVSVWRWHVSNVLRAQQSSADPPPVLRERRASAIESGSAFVQRHERYFADGAPVPKSDLIRPH
jgi:hypothetical protein